MIAPREILFVPLGKAACDQQLATALYLRDRGDLQPHFLLIWPGDHILIPQLKKQHIGFATLDPVKPPTVTRTKRRAPTEDKPAETFGLYRRLAQMVDGLPLGRTVREWLHVPLFVAWALGRTLQTASALHQRMRLARRQLVGRHLRLAIVSQERANAVLPVLHVLRQRRVPVLYLPAADSSPDGSARLRRDDFLLLAGLNPETNLPRTFSLNGRAVALVNRWAERWFPKQVYASRWGRMHFLVPADLLALHLLGLLPKNIWYQGTSFADYLMLSGSDERTMCLAAGIPPERLLMFGADELDVLHEHNKRRATIRAELTRQHFLEPQRRLLVLAPAPLWEHGLLDARAQWQALRELLKVTCKQGCQVLVSLHPRINPDHYQWMEAEFPVRLADRPLKEIIVAADLFVASYSSTIRWALALGLPVLNVDFWQLDLTMFVGLQGYRTVTTPAAYAEALADMLAARPPPRAAPSSQIVMDGQARQRLLRFIENLAPARSTRQAA